MLQKLCDNCKKEMELNINYYDESTFNLLINTEDGKEINFSGDLCEECENIIIEKIKDVLKTFSINEQIIEKEEEEIILEEDEMKLIEDKQDETI